MTALELLEELERQIVEWGYVNANTTLLFKIRDAIKELEKLETKLIECMEKYTDLEFILIKDKQ